MDELCAPPLPRDPSVMGTKPARRQAVMTTIAGGLGGRGFREFWKVR